MYFLSSAMMGTGTGREPMLFRVLLVLVVTEPFSKSISEMFNNPMSPRRKPVPKANRILILNV